MNDDLTHLEKVLLDGLKADAGRKSCEYPRVALYIVQAMMLRSMRAAEQTDAMSIGRAMSKGQPVPQPQPQPQPPVGAASRRYTIVAGYPATSETQYAQCGIVAVLELRTWVNSETHAIIDLRVNEELDCTVCGRATRIIRTV